MEIEVEVKQVNGLKDLDEFLDNTMTVNEFVEMRVKSAIESAKKTLVKQKIKYKEERKA